MGETHRSALGCSFNGSIRVEGRPERLTTNAGVLALRESDERIGLTAWLANALRDRRSPLLITHPLVELLRARLYLMAQGHRDQDDADRLRHDPALRMAVSERRGLSPLETPQNTLTPDGLASQPTQSRLIEALSCEDNLSALNAALFEWARRDVFAHRGRRFKRVTLDVDSTAIRVHGRQAGSANNGHYHMRCYHPIVTMLAETGAWLAAKLRPGNVWTAEGVVDHLLPVIDRVETGIARVASVRGDAGFPEEKLLAALEGRRIGYAFRLKTNPVLQRKAQPFLLRPPGRPPNEPRTWFHELAYRAEPWSRARRVVLVVLERPGELFLDSFFLLTNWSVEQMPAAELLDFYRQRGTMEGHIGELKSVLEPALSCTTRPKSHINGRAPKTRTPARDAEQANAATFLLYALAYNLANTLRRTVSAAVPGRHGAAWSLDRLRRVLLVAAARVIVSARRATFVINDASTDLWRSVWSGLDRLRPLDTS